MEKKNIAFIEMETHSALLEQWYLLLKSMQYIDFHFFVSAKVNEKLTAIPKEYITIVVSVAKTDFSIFDGVVVNTLHRNFKDYQNLFQSKPVLCLVHNLNFSLFFKTISFSNIFKEKEKFVYFFEIIPQRKSSFTKKNYFKSKTNRGDFSFGFRCDQKRGKVCGQFLFNPNELL